MSDTMDFLDVLKKRAKPIVKDGTAHSASSDYAILGADGKVFFSDPKSEKTESDDSAMRHRFKISTPAVDRAGDSVIPAGCLNYLQRYKDNPVVFLNHCSFGLPIARSQAPDGEFALAVRDDAIFADAYFHGKTEESEKTYELIKLGYLRAASIGFRPIKAERMPKEKNKDDEDTIRFQYYPGLKFMEWELLEWSVVGIPCNAEALDGMKSWMGKNIKAENNFSLALKAMLADDGGKSVTVTVPAEPPGKSIPKVDLPSLVKDPMTFSADEVEQAIQNVEKAFNANQGVPAPALEIQSPPVEAKAEPEVKDIPAVEIPAVLVVSADPSVEGIKKIVEDMAKLYEGKIKSLEEKIAKLEDLPPAPNIPPETQVTDIPEIEPPLGAKVLLRAIKHMSDCCSYIDSKRSLIEHAKTGPFLDEQRLSIDGVCKALSKFGKKHYSDHFPDEPAGKSIETPTLVSVPNEPKQVDWTPEQIKRLNQSVERLAKANAKAEKGLYAITGKKAK